MQKRRTLRAATLTLALGTTFATSALTGGTASAVAPPETTVRQQADRIMNLSYEEFEGTPRITPFNWTTDGCSVPGPFAFLTPYRKVFHLACTQHDFGYRNYGGAHELKLSPTRETKNWIDGRFRTELIRTCENTYKTPLKRQSCLSAADAYYLGVNTTPAADRAFF